MESRLENWKRQNAAGGIDFCDAEGKEEQNSIVGEDVPWKLI